jgi:hypothetical protein
MLQFAVRSSELPENPGITENPGPKKIGCSILVVQFWEFTRTKKRGRSSLQLYYYPH